jgi:cyanophycinase
MDAHPELLGIGIDEATVLIVRGQTADVLGQNSVFFFDGSNGSRGSIQVSAGKSFHFGLRKILP